MGTPDGLSEPYRPEPSKKFLRVRYSASVSAVILEEDQRGVIVAVIDGHIVDANPRALEMLGANDVVGVDVFRLLREHVADGDDAISRFRAKGLVRGLHTSLKRLDGSLKRVEVTLRQADAHTVALLITDEDAIRSDALTGIGNRTEFEARQKEGLERLARGQIRALSLLLLDVDHFKDVNDTFGHSVGDHVLCQVAKAVAKCVRQCDTVARVGGEEIAVLFSDADQLHAAHLAERIRKSVEDLRINHQGRSIPVTVSIGSSTLTDRDLMVMQDDVPASCAEEFFARADAALYESKHGGRNRISIHA